MVHIPFALLLFPFLFPLPLVGSGLEGNLKHLGTLTKGRFLFFLARQVSLFSPGYSGFHSVDQAGLRLRDLPASASQVLGLKVCATTAWLASS